MPDDIPTQDTLSPSGVKIKGNFNSAAFLPSSLEIGQTDIATGIPDSDNGIFSMTGLAHQFDHFATLSRQLNWIGDQLGVASMGILKPQRVRQPENNRHPQNRI